PHRVTRLVIELSTVGEQCAAECADRVIETGMGYVDSPVSGGKDGASTGRLTLMVAGSSGDLDAARPIFDQLSTRVIEMGSRPGMAQVVKLVNNIINSTSIAI